MTFNPSNILVIDFGQLGDVTLSLPALEGIRRKFLNSRITVLTGEPTASLVEASGYSDVILSVDRVALRDGQKIWAIARIFDLVKDIRRRHFDFVIDLHSLSETNLLAFLSGARKRLFADRPGRSLNFLSNFTPRPPAEDRTKHAVDRYLDVLEPLQIPDLDRVPRLKLKSAHQQKIDQILTSAAITPKDVLVGMSPGAGHPGRRWPLKSFAEVAVRLEDDEGVRVVVFPGPEEQALMDDITNIFSPSTLVILGLNIPELAAAFARMALLISNNSGPMHIAAAVGTPVISLLGRLTPDSFTPVGNQHRIVFAPSVSEITFTQVYT
ncbi:MAG: glycosyltransferase family 9 protein, partial [Pyrinomonadaceae bacterium]